MATIPRNHLRSLVVAVAFGAISLTANAVRAHDGNANAATANAAASGQLVPVNDKADVAWLAKARADYPLTSCIVSGDKFDGGEMGKQWMSSTSRTESRTVWCVFAAKIE